MRFVAFFFSFSFHSTRYVKVYEFHSHLIGPVSVSRRSVGGGSLQGAGLRSRKAAHRQGGAQRGQTMRRHARQQRNSGHQRYAPFDVPISSIKLEQLLTPHNTFAFADPKIFTFDGVADESSAQEEIFAMVGKSITDSCIAGTRLPHFAPWLGASCGHSRAMSWAGYNGSIFAYGQTGSGKTHTIQGALPCSRSVPLPPLSSHAATILTRCGYGQQER
jgi:hypothetical protein